MIPKFPEFKKLEFSDKQEIDAITSQYEPYSDFHFETMWSWDTNDSLKISNLNGNLILLTKDIFTDQVVCSYLGNHKVNNTLYNLFDFLDSTGTQSPKISLVPEISLKGIDFSKYFIEIDLNTCDYIYTLRHLSQYSGNQYTQKRGRRNTFMRNYPDVSVKVLDLKDPVHRQEILNLNSAWVQNKAKYQNEADNDKEALALTRFMDANFDSAYCLGVYHKELIGYAIFSFHRNDYALNQFIKADISYKGVYEFLMHECATFLGEKGYEFLNYLEDMGMSGLRKAKMTYRPVKFLRKYFIKRL